MRRLIPAIGRLGLMGSFLWHAPAAAQAARDALALCARSVIPALFPFFVAVSCFTSLGLARETGRLLAPLAAPLLGCSGTGAAAFLLGLLGGYPVGGRTAAELYRSGAVDRAEAMHLLSFCNNCGPAFVVGVAGIGCFGSRRAGLWLYAIHVLSALLAARLHRPSAPERLPPEPAPPRPFAAALTDAVDRGARTMLTVCGFVVFFSVLTGVIAAAAGPLPPVLLGFAELTGGILRLTPDRAGFTAAAALLSWGGLCVHAQTAAALQDTDLSLGPQLTGKAMQAVLSAAMAWIAGRWLF